jgi:hypothetical protein
VNLSDLVSGQAARQAVVDALLAGADHGTIKRCAALASAYALRDVPADDSNAENRGNGSRAAKAITDGYSKLVEIAAPDTNEGSQQATTLKAFVRQLGDARAQSPQSADALIVATGQTEATKGVDWLAIQAQGLDGTSDVLGPLGKADTAADAVHVVATPAERVERVDRGGGDRAYPADLDTIASVPAARDRRGCALSLRAKGIGRDRVRRHVRCSLQTLKRWEDETRPALAMPNDAREADVHVYATA